jgi:signal transduction histidine kinase
VRRDREESLVEQVACVAHDLKSPLSAISMLVSMLRSRAHEVDVANAFKIMERNIAYMARLLREMIDLSSLEHGTLALRRDSVDLAALLTSIHLRGFLGESRVWIQASDGPLEVTADADRLERVIVNLIENALKYSTSAVTVRAERRSERARVIVSDRGLGIRKEDVASLFEMHRRLDHALEHEGAGLGLYICRKIVEAHGGTIGVTSTFGAGSSFYVDLPLVLEASG